MHFNFVVITILADSLSLGQFYYCEINFPWKVSGRKCVSPRGELGVSKDGHFQNIKMYKNGKFDSH